MIKAVMFDLDGTILDSIDAWWQAFNEGAAPFHLEPVPKERLLEFMNSGSKLAEILIGIYPELGPDPDSARIAEIMEEMRTKYPTNSGGKVDLIDGALDLLHLLKQRGLKIGVVTSRSLIAEKQWRELARLEVDHFFDCVVTAFDSRRKPAPDTVFECLGNFNVRPEECIIIGDSLADVIAGKAAGVKTVAVATGVSDLASLTAESPDFIFDNLVSLMDNIDLVLDGNKRNK